MPNVIRHPLMRAPVVLGAFRRSDSYCAELAFVTSTRYPRASNALINASMTRRARSSDFVPTKTSRQAMSQTGGWPCFFSASRSRGPDDATSG